jgi:hypothetical protein
LAGEKIIYCLGTKDVILPLHQGIAFFHSPHLHTQARTFYIFYNIQHCSFHHTSSISKMAIIKSFLTLTLLLGSSLGALAAGNKTATNGVGSTPAQVSIDSSVYQRITTDNPSQRHVISIDEANSLIAAAVREANTVIPENIAITDPSGMLVAFHRMDNAFPGSIDISIKKARTTVLFNGAYSTADLNAAAQGPLYGLYSPRLRRLCIS